MMSWIINLDIWPQNRRPICQYGRLESHLERIDSQSSRVRRCVFRILECSSNIFTDLDSNGIVQPLGLSNIARQEITAVVLVFTSNDCGLCHPIFWKPTRVSRTIAEVWKHQVQQSIAMASSLTWIFDAVLFDGKMIYKSN